MALVDSAPLAELFTTLAPDIAALRAKLGDALPASQPGDDWDDLWLLRYCLSFKTLPDRAAAVQKCLAYRAKHKTMLELCSRGEFLPNHEDFERLCVSGYHVTGASDGGPLYVVRTGLSAPGSVMQRYGKAAVLLWLMYLKEQAFRTCDAATRKAGRLVKMHSLVDFAGSQLHKVDFTYMRTIGESSRISEYAYPKLVHHTVLLRPPAWFSAVFSLVKRVLPAKSVSKIRVCPGPSAKLPSASSCPFAARHFAPDALPSFLGGGCHCPALGGCIARVPNTASSPEGELADPTVSLAAGGRHEVVLASPAQGVLLSWSLTNLEGGGVELSVTFQGLTLMEPLKVKPEECPRSGSLPLPGAGSVVLRLRNQSMLKAKSFNFSALVSSEAAEELSPSEAD